MRIHEEYKKTGFFWIPEKEESRNKTSVGEIVGYTTSLVSIIALMKSF